METYLKLFEEAIKTQAKTVGEKQAFELARKAGLGVSRDGHIVSCTGNPQLVLLRLVRHFTAGGNLDSLLSCMPLLDKVMDALPDEQQEEATVEAAEAPGRA
jgi:hypothetical protein